MWWLIMLIVASAAAIFVYKVYKAMEAREAKAASLRRQGWDHAETCGPFHYVVWKGSGKKHVLDEQGRTVLEVECEYLDYQDGGYIQYTKTVYGSKRKGIVSLDGKVRTEALYDYTYYDPENKVVRCGCGYIWEADRASSYVATYYSTDPWRFIGTVKGIHDIFINGKARVKTGPVTTVELPLNGGAQRKVMDGMLRVRASRDLCAIEAEDGKWVLITRGPGQSFHRGEDGELYVAKYELGITSVSEIDDWIEHRYFEEFGKEQFYRNTWDYADVQKGRMYVYERQYSLFGGWLRYEVERAESLVEICIVSKTKVADINDRRNQKEIATGHGFSVGVVDQEIKFSNSPERILQSIIEGKD